MSVSQTLSQWLTITMSQSLKSHRPIDMCILEKCLTHIRVDVVPDNRRPIGRLRFTVGGTDNSGRENKHH